MKEECPLADKGQGCKAGRPSETLSLCPSEMANEGLSREEQSGQGGRGGCQVSGPAGRTGPGSWLQGEGVAVPKI